MPQLTLRNSLGTLTFALVSSLAFAACTVGEVDDDTDGNFFPDAGGAGGEVPGGDGDGDSGTGGGSGGASVVDGPDVTTIEGYCEVKVGQQQGWCDFVDQCCSAVDVEDDAFDVPACTSDETLDSCVEDVNAQVTAGAVWNGDSAQGCLDELAKTVPEAPSECLGLEAARWSHDGRDLPGYDQIAACRDMLRGDKATNEPCTYHSECGEFLFCGYPTEVSMETECLVIGGMGVECVLDADCELGLFCGGPVDDRTCGTIGESGSACTFDYDCAEGLLCEDAECKAELFVGDECGDSLGACERGASCESGFCTQTGLNGETCSESSECPGRCDTDANECVDICGGSVH